VEALDGGSGWIRRRVLARKDKRACSLWTFLRTPDSASPGGPPIEIFDGLRVSLALEDLAMMSLGHAPMDGSGFQLRALLDSGYVNGRRAAVPSDVGSLIAS